MVDQEGQGQVPENQGQAPESQIPDHDPEVKARAEVAARADPRAEVKANLGQGQRAKKGQ